MSGRNDVDFDEMVNLDIEYVVNVSLREDFVILLRMVFVFIHPNGAY